MAERCCVCDEHGENQCPNDAAWHTWDQDGRYHDTSYDYCDEHLLDGMQESGRTIVWDIKLLEPADAKEAILEMERLDRRFLAAEEAFGPQMTDALLAILNAGGTISKVDDEFVVIHPVSTKEGARAMDVEVPHWAEDWEGEMKHRHPRLSGVLRMAHEAMEVNTTN